MHVLNVSTIEIMSFPSVFEMLILGNFPMRYMIYLKLVIIDDF